MPMYEVTAIRTTFYEVEAETEDEAIDAMIDGLAEEVDGITSNITATKIRETVSTDDED